MIVLVSQNGADLSADLSDPAFRRLSDKLERKTGIVLNDSKKGLAVSRLGRRLRSLGVDSFASYCDILDGPGGDEEFQEMVLLLTTNVTRFFREAHHFDSFGKVILPKMVDRLERGGKLRVWSAGCSSGEEPYSLAMTILDAIPAANDLDIRVLGTDLDRKMVATARNAVYRLTDEDFAGTPLLERHLQPIADGTNEYRVSPKVASLVTFAELNLLEAWPMQGRFDVIFCRNVVIYFATETQEALWSRFAAALNPGGHLMIGHSERVSGSASSRLKSNGVTQYQLNP